jgi:hypothetical protein
VDRAPRDSALNDVGFRVTGEVEQDVTTMEKGGSQVNENPFMLLAEVVRVLANVGTGPILGGTCVPGAHFGSLLTCTVVQDPP